VQYVHFPLNEEIRSVGGYYKVLEEGALDFEGRKVLFVLKAAHVDTSCCGAGGVGFISVPGYIDSYKSGTNTDGHPVTEVSRIRDKAARKAIKEELARRYSYINVIDFD